MRSTILLLALLAPAATAQPRSLTVDPGASTLAYTGRHPLHSWTGTSHAVAGTLQFDPADPAATAVTLVVPVASFGSGNGNRDSNMLDVVEVDRHPEVRFVSASVQVDRWAPTAEGFEGAWRVRGALTFHGVTRPVEIPVSVVVDGDAFVARGSFAVSLERFDVERPRLMLMAIRDGLDLEAVIRASLPPTAR